MWDLRTLAQFQGKEMSPELFQIFMDGSVRLFSLAVEHNVVVMTTDFQAERSQTECYFSSLM